TTVQMKSRPEFLDLQLPRARFAESGLLNIAVGTGFPVTLPWLPLAPPSSQNSIEAVPLDFTCEEDGARLATPNGQRQARLTWARSSGTEVKITGKYLVPAGAERIRVELPRPLQVLDRGAKVRVKTPDQLVPVIETVGSEAAGAVKHETQLSLDT